MANFYVLRGAIITLLLGLAGRSAAQTTPADTTRLHYAEELLPAVPAADARPPVPRQERAQWKLGLNNFLLGSYPYITTGDGHYYSRYGLHLAYERHLGRAWSGQAEVSPAVTRYQYYPSLAIRTRLAMRVQVAGRYYYNLERRRRLGHSTTGFSANYLSLAVGTGLGGPVRETPFYLLAARRPAADVALLYGLQRRLGRYGFLDASLGLGTLLTRNSPDALNLVGSLRVGLVVPPASAGPAPVPPDELKSLTPRFYVGLQGGESDYRLHYSNQNPYPTATEIVIGAETRTEEYTQQYNPYSVNYLGVGAGYGAYSNTTNAYQVYAGYYCTPRLAVQVGVQRDASTYSVGGTFVTTGSSFQFIDNHRLEERLVAVPVLVRYALTRAFLRHLQFDVLGGLIPVWASANFRDYRVINNQVSDQLAHQFQRRTLGLNANLALNVSYGLGRRRRVQATAEYGVVQDLRGLRQQLQASYSAGLRYRFGYR